MEEEFKKALGYNLGTTFFAMGSLLTRNMQSQNLDLTHQQAKLILFVGFNEGAKQQDVADILRKDKPGVTKMVDLLEKKKFIERRQDKDDRRNKLLHLTKEGHVVRQSLMPIIKKTIKEATGVLSHEEHEQLIELLTRVRTNIEQLMQEDNSK